MYHNSRSVLSYLLAKYKNLFVHLLCDCYVADILLRVLNTESGTYFLSIVGHFKNMFDVKIYANIKYIFYLQCSTFFFKNLYLC